MDGELLFSLHSSLFQTYFPPQASIWVGVLNNVDILVCAFYRKYHGLLA